MIELVGKSGYDAVALRQLTALAGVSTRTFYDHFEGKEECFLRTYELVVKRMGERIVSAQAGEPDWSRRVELALQGFAAELTNKPRAARLAFLEIFAAGPAAHDAMARAEAYFEELVKESFAGSHHQGEMSPLLAKAIVSGVTFVARTRMVDADELTAAVIADELSQWVLSLQGMPTGSSRPEVHMHTHGNLSPQRAEPGEREAILAATAKIVAANGYWQLTMPRILTAAGLRKNSFTTHFSGVEDCFLAVLEQRTTGLVDQTMNESKKELSSPKRVQRTVEDLCAAIADDPITARLLFVEAYSAGRAATAHQDGLLAGLANELARESGDRGQSASLTHAEASLAGIRGIVGSYVDSGRESQLPDIAPLLTFLLLAPINGDR